jgi:hypothetical protein
MLVKKLYLDPHPYKPFGPTFQPVKPLFLDFEVKRGKAKVVKEEVVEFETGLGITVEGVLLSHKAFESLLEEMHKSMLYVEPTRVRD